MVQILVDLRHFKSESHLISSYSVVKDLSSRFLNPDPRGKTSELNLLWSHHFFVVGLGRLELPTPRLSSVCSNQLSYRPLFKTGLLPGHIPHASWLMRLRMNRLKEKMEVRGL